MAPSVATEVPVALATEVPVALATEVPVALATEVPVAGAAMPLEVAELRKMCEELCLEVRQLKDVVEGMSEAQQRAEREAVLREVDTRFEWLTEQVSERLVVLGNELAPRKRGVVGAKDGLQNGA